MARKARHINLSVFLNGLLVGTLRRDSSGATSFQYMPDWLNAPDSSPVSLSLPLSERRYVGNQVTAVFDNLLPDNQQILRRVAEKVGATGTDALSLLSILGRDCVGALQFLPEGTTPEAPGAVTGEAVSDDWIFNLLDNLEQAPLGMGEDTEFRISLAGAQEKTALLFHEGHWNKPLGTTATTHILKPENERLTDMSLSVENEYLCLKLLSALGLPVAQAEITDILGRRVLVVERFDRRWLNDGRLMRLPQEDFCQALGVPPSLKYQSEGGPNLADLLRLLSASDDPEQDQRTMLKAVMAFWLLAATDGHAKNFSLMLQPGGRFRLAPLYDVLSVQPTADAGKMRRTEMKLAMSLGDSRHYRVDEIQFRHFVQTAAAARIGRSIVNQCFDEIAARIDAAFASISEANVSKSLITSIHRAALARLRGVRITE